MQNSKQEESPKLSKNDQMIDDAMGNLSVPPSPPNPYPREKGEGEVNLREWAEKMTQEGVDNLNRNALKNG
jgi:hypothetical protein